VPFGDQSEGDRTADEAVRVREGDTHAVRPMVAAVDTKSRLAARKFSEAAYDALSTRPKVAGHHRVIIGKTNPKGLR
jgi:hypothetical protein